MLESSSTYSIFSCFLLLAAFNLVFNLQNSYFWLQFSLAETCSPFSSFQRCKLHHQSAFWGKLSDALVDWGCSALENREEHSFRSAYFPSVLRYCDTVILWAKPTHNPSLAQSLYTSTPGCDRAFHAEILLNASAVQRQEHHEPGCSDLQESSAAQQTWGSEPRRGRCIFKHNTISICAGHQEKPSTQH